MSEENNLVNVVSVTTKITVQTMLDLIAFLFPARKLRYKIVGLPFPSVCLSAVCRLSCVRIFSEPSELIVMKILDVMNIV